MKKPYSKSVNLRILVICFVLVCAAFIINSCRKDSKNTSQADLPLAISQAKAWYESTYPLNSSTTDKLVTQSINSPFDFSQIIKPDWSHASSYVRLGRNVIEMPIDPSVTFGSALENKATGKAFYPKENSRSSFILLSDGKNYDAYIMTILADPVYIKNDLSKLANNTYRKHDTDFTGMVFYFTPKGQYMGGFEFKNGQLMTPGVQTTPSSGQVIQSVNPPNLKPAVDEPTVDCTFYYMLTYEDGVLVDQEFLYADCTPTPGGGSGGSGTGGTSGGSPAPPPACPAATGGNGSDAVQSLVINVTEPPPGDGGMPPPTSTPCTVTTPVADTTKNPCAQIAAVNTMAQNSARTAINNQIYNDNYTGHEYGDDQNLTSWPPNGTYTNTPITTDLNDTQFTPTFTWNSTSGYTINITHGHPAGDAPSPRDVFQLIINMNNTDFKNAGAAALNYYKQNASIAVITTNGTYVVTGANYSGLSTLAAQYNDDPAAFNANYESIANANGFSTEYALLKIFGNTINIFKSNPNKNIFSVLTFDANGNVVEITCPSN